MSSHSPTTARARRARRSFWILVTVAVLAAGAFSAGLGADPGPLTGLSVAVSGIVLAVALTLAARVMVASERARRRVSPGDAGDHEA